MSLAALITYTPGLRGLPTGGTLTVYVDDLLNPVLLDLAPDQIASHRDSVRIGKSKKSLVGGTRWKSLDSGSWVPFIPGR